MQVKQLVIGGRKASYWESNPSKSEVIVFIHGLGGDHRGLLDYANSLTGYRCLILDLPGQGLSEPLKQSHSFVNYAKFLNSFRQQLGIGRFYLIGHSFGCYIALQYAKDFPDGVNKLVLMNPVVDYGQTLSSKLGKFFGRLTFKLPDKLCHLVLANKLAVYLTDRAVLSTANKSIRRKILAEDYLNYTRADIRTVKESYQALSSVLPDKIIPNQDLRTLIVAGKKDGLTKAKTLSEFAAKFRKGRIEWVDGGHLYPVEEPQAAAKLTKGFIKGQTGLNP